MSIVIPVKNSVLVTDSLPDGQYVGVLYRMVQLGTQPERFKGTVRPVRKILLSWIIPSAYRMIDGESRPVHVHKKYTESLWEKAHLRKDIITILGRDVFNELIDGQENYELERLLGLTCLINTTQRRFGPNNQSYAKITSFEPLSDDEIIPEIDQETESLSFGNFNWTVFASLTERLRKTIESSPEFGEMPADIRAAELAKIEARYQRRTASGSDEQPNGQPGQPAPEEGDEWWRSSVLSEMS